MRVLVIGGTGHIGSYLVPRLTCAGHKVTVVARKPQPQYANPLLGWAGVCWIMADRPAEEISGAWLKRMAAIETDVVIDAICYTPEQNRVMYEAFRGRIRQLIHIGTIWSYGPAERVPYEESQPRKPITQYGRRKARIEAFLHDRHATECFPATIIHPGHISGRGWLPIDPQGSLDGEGVYRRLARGEPVHLPDMGQATLHHVHAADVAQLCELVMEHRDAALGQSFSAVAPYAMSLVGCCRAVAALFGVQPNLKFVPLAALAEAIGEQSAGIIREHAAHSPCCSMAKAQRILGYQPRYSTEQIYAEVVERLIESGELSIA